MKNVKKKLLNELNDEDFPIRDEHDDREVRDMIREQEISEARERFTEVLNRFCQTFR